MRFADILTTASAVANYLGQPDVEAAHVLAAIEIVGGRRSVENLGRPVSPLLRRGAAPGATEGVRELVQRWFAELGSNANAEVEEESLERLMQELREVAAREGFSDLFEGGEEPRSGGA